jgi:hypothetical protein
MQNEKAVATNNGFNKINKQLTMTNSTQKTEIKQSKLNFGNPPEIIICFACHREREFDGYIFRLVRVCADCRTESEVLITRKRFERRRASK